MSCDLWKSGECPRPDADQFRCDNCSESLSLLHAPTMEGNFVLVTKSPGRLALLNVKRNEVVAEVKTGKFSKFYSGPIDEYVG